MTYYYTGGGTPQATATSKLFLAMFLGGFPDGYEFVNIIDGSYITNKDPYFRFGAAGGGGQTTEIGLYNDYRIEIDATNGIRGWNGSGWTDLLAGGGATNLNELTDVTIDGTPADNELLSWDNGSSKWINQTPAEAGLSVTGHTHGQLHDEDHDNTHHTTNYHTETDGAGVVTVHSDVNSVGSGDIITTGERNGLHTRLHSITDILDHSASNHKIFYSDGSAHIIELTLGADGDVLTSGGPTSAPTFETPLSGGDTKEVSLQYVEDTGLVLSSAKVITSADENLSFTFGRTLIDARLNNYMVLSHRGMTTTANYSTRQNSVGETRINSAAGQVLNLCIGGAIKASVNASGLQVGSDARITEFDNGVLANSATKAPTSAAVFAAIDAAGGFTPPIGFIAMYSGVWVDNTTIVGWYKCDGNNGTPNLVDKFIRGAATSGGGGGSDDAVVVSHNHDLLVEGGSSSLQHATTATATRSWNNQIIGNRGVSGVNANIPAYYALIFIMRIS